MRGRSPSSRPALALEKRDNMVVWKRPSVETKYHIDYDWWQANGKDVRVAVRGQLCKE